jgi:rSAM/selenodomain-associated transferase 2
MCKHMPAIKSVIQGRHREQCLNNGGAGKDRRNAPTFGIHLSGKPQGRGLSKNRMTKPAVAAITRLRTSRLAFGSRWRLRNARRYSRAVKVTATPMITAPRNHEGNSLVVSTTIARMTFSIIIPTLNEEQILPDTLRTISALPGQPEVIVADGGSSDRTLAIAQSAGALVVSSERGRGQQQAAGAARASGEVLWFLHADSVPDIQSLEAIEEALANVKVAGGNFTLRFDGETRAARTLTMAYPYFRLLGLCYGDSGIFIRRNAYDALGGFRPFPLFEDVDLVWRIRRVGRFVRLRCPLTTSSRRFEGRSFTRTFAHWTLLQILFWAGVSPVRLARMYAHIRRRE